jgi:hypothetical protein
MMTKLRNFGEDLAFLQEHVETVVLSNGDDQRVVVVPEWQGRTMTSTARGDEGFSYGWVNYRRIQSGQTEPQINLFGGEDRFWIGPEGSQFSFFFDPAEPMDLSHWRTPPPLDVEPFQLVGQDTRQVSFERRMRLVNYAAQPFDLHVERTVRIADPDETANCLGMTLPSGLQLVCHESHNRVTNAGDRDWTAETGLPAVWILGMNKPSPAVTVLVPFQRGAEPEKGPIVTADYFGKLDDSRLNISESSGLIYFLGDGRLRSKLGVGFRRAVDFLGAWDAGRECLTVVQFNLPADPGPGYTNNLWKAVDDPYEGDVINSYNDGPNESGGLMGPFYELETLSPALALCVGDSFLHRHRTIHLEGCRESLDQVMQHVFGVNLAQVERVFASRPQGDY